MASSHGISQDPFFSKVSTSAVSGASSVAGTKGKDSLIWGLLRQESRYLGAIQKILQSRVEGDSEPVKTFVKEIIGPLEAIDETYANENPLSAMFILILRDDPSEDWLRDAAADAYKRAQLELYQSQRDSKFEEAYAYLKDPTILLSHMLLVSNLWKPLNPDNKDHYNEQMSGLFNDVKAKEIFISSRSKFQTEKIEEFISNLRLTSSVLLKKFKSKSELQAFVVIYPYTEKKSIYRKSLFEVEKVTSYSVETFSKLLTSSVGYSCDSHFEAIFLWEKIVKAVSNIPAILIEENGAPDIVKYSDFINKNAPKRKIQIVDVVPISGH